MEIKDGAHYWEIFFPEKKTGVATHFSKITVLQYGEKRWIGILKTNFKKLLLSPDFSVPCELAQIQW